MENEAKVSFKTKVKNTVSTVKEYWTTPPKGNYVPYKEVACLSGAGFGVHWFTTLSSVISLDASSFLVGASIGLKPTDLYIMLTIANIVGIPLGVFRSWYYDNHHLKGGKFLPFIKLSGLPILLISTIFVWLPFENMQYITKAVVVWLMYMLLNIFLSFYTESYNYFQQIFTPDSQERANVMSISQIIYSMAPTISQALIPFVADKTWGLDNIMTYRVIYPIFSVIGFIMCTIFFSKVKERLILPKKQPEPVRMLDALREVAKNKYFWITQVAAWVVFLESGYAFIFSRTFFYAYDGKYAGSLGLANTIIGNAALWAMMLCPFAIKAIGKRNILIISNAVNMVFLMILYFVYQNIWLMCILWYINNFISTFWNIIQHNISADMRDYHQWKTGVRVDGLFGPLGLIGTFIGFFTGAFYPRLYEYMGLKEDHSVLYDDVLRNNLFEVLIICSIIGAFLNLLPFFFYDLTENKHKAYVGVLKIRAMFENYSIGLLEDEELIDVMSIINEARESLGREKINIEKKDSREIKKQIKEINLAIERAPIIMQDLNKFTTKAGMERLRRAQEDASREELYLYDNIAEEMKAAKTLPKKTEEEKEIRTDALNNLRAKKRAAALIKKYGKENIILPPESEKEEILARESSSFFDSLKIRKDLKAYMKKVSVYKEATKPYTEAKNLLLQAEYYTHFEEIEDRYNELVCEE